ncbi:hypothetical protein CKAH01_09805 [Colletotrichum kahawae]|uniref:Uncharacterized protein n=1 Tax=Colletotrichum kahawae TaxID=34407 RepID=A0AAD9XZK3_COLKA|nr:hypothetical protein CKAH01_09805 [Colletotrichum kahawae]
MDPSAGLPTSGWNVDCEVMEEVMENDDLLSLLKPYIHDRHDIHSLCLVNRMFNMVFSQSLFEHLVVKHTHIHCVEPDSEEFAALPNSPNLRYTRELSFLHMDQLSYTEDDSSRYGPILNGAICQIVKRCPNLRNFTFSAPSYAEPEGLVGCFVWKETLDCLYSSCPALQSLSLEQAFPRLPYQDADQRATSGSRDNFIGISKFPEFSNLIARRLIGIDESAASWQKSIAGLLSLTPHLEELSLSIRPSPSISRYWKVRTYRIWKYFLPCLCDEYKTLGKPPLKLRKLNLDENFGFVCDAQGSIGYIDSLTDLKVLKELRIFTSQLYSAGLTGALPPLMPYKLFTYDTMPRLRRFAFGDMDDDIMEWLIQLAETPFKDQLTLCNDGVDYWEGRAELFEAVSREKARKREEKPLINFTTLDLDPILRPILWTDFDSPLFPYTANVRLVVPGRFRLGDAKHRRFRNPDRLGDCTWIKSMRVFVESVSPSMNELLRHLNGMHAIEQLMIVSYTANDWGGFARLDDSPAWETNARRIAVALPSLKYLKVNRVPWRFRRAKHDNGLVAERLTGVEDDMQGTFPPLSDLPVSGAIRRAWRKSVISPE